MSHYLYTSTASEQSSRNLSRIFTGPEQAVRAMIRVQIQGVGSQIGEIKMPRSVLLVLSPSVTAAALMATCANLLTTGVSLENVMTVQKLLSRSRLFKEDNSTEPSTWKLLSPETCPWNGQLPVPVLRLQPLDSTTSNFVVLATKTVQLLPVSPRAERRGRSDSSNSASSSPGGGSGKKVQAVMEVVEEEEDDGFPEGDEDSPYLPSSFDAPSRKASLTRSISKGKEALSKMKMNGSGIRSRSDSVGVRPFSLASGSGSSDLPTGESGAALGLKKSRMVRSHTEDDEGLRKLGLDNTFKTLLLAPTTTASDMNHAALRALMKGQNDETKVLAAALLKDFTHFVVVNRKTKLLHPDQLVWPLFEADPSLRLVFKEPKGKSKAESKLFREKSIKRAQAFGKLVNYQQEDSAGPSSSITQQSLQLGYKYLRSSQPVLLGLACRPTILTKTRDLGSLTLLPDCSLSFASASLSSFSISLAS